MYDIYPRDTDDKQLTTYINCLQIFYYPESKCALMIYRETDAENQQIVVRLLREVKEIADVKNNALCTDRRIRGK